MNEIIRDHKLLSLKLCCFVTIIMISAGQSNAQSNNKGAYFENWPDGCSPVEIGDRLAGHFVATPHPNFGRPTPPRVITYPEVCTWYGALTFAKESENSVLLEKLAHRYEPLFTYESGMIPSPDHVDYIVFAAVPLELYMQTENVKYLYTGLYFAERQWGVPEGKRADGKSFYYYELGYSWQTRLWIDDMFMITAAQSQAFRATGNRRYIDQAAKEMAMYLDSLQQPNGLFYHAPDVPFFWGRGNGWMAVGMAELLRSLPEDNP